MSNSRVSGKIRDKRGTPVTGVACDIDVYDKDSRDSHLGSSQSVVGTGAWGTRVVGKAPGEKVLVVFSYSGDPKLAGAEFMETGTTSTTTSTTSTTSTTVAGATTSSSASSTSSTSTMSTTSTASTTSSTAPSGPWLSGWDNRIVLTIDKDKIDATLPNFPVMVHLSASSGITSADVSAVFDELTSDANRKKIAVTSSDAETELYVEIERWDDANEEAWLHVKVPSVSSSADTILYLYYDADHADNTTYVGDTTDAVVHNVWDSDHIAVWHMAQDPNGDGADAIKDSTSNAIDLTPNGAMTSDDLVDGKVGKAIDFDGSGDDLETDGNIPSLNINSDDFEFSFWVNFNNLPANNGESDQIFGIADPINDRRSYLLDVYQVSSVVYFRFLTYNGTSLATTWVSRTITPSTGTWYYFSVRRDGSNVHVYQDGVELGTATAIGTPSIYENTDDSFFIGSYNGIWSLCDLIIDEFRVTIGDSRSGAWVKATYNSLCDSLITFSG